jgi:hypothetical protein
MADASEFFADLARRDPADLLEVARNYLNEQYAGDTDAGFGPLVRGLPADDYRTGGELLKPMLRLEDYMAVTREPGSRFTVDDYRRYKDLVMRTYPDYEFHELDVEIPEESLQLYERASTGIRSALRYRTPQHFKTASAQNEYWPLNDEGVGLVKSHIAAQRWPELTGVVFGTNPFEVLGVMHHPDMLPYASMKQFASSGLFSVNELAVLNTLMWLAIRRYNFRYDSTQFKRLVAGDLRDLWRGGRRGTNIYTGAPARDVAGRYRA